MYIMYDGLISHGTQTMWTDEDMYDDMSAVHVDHVRRRFLCVSPVTGTLRRQPSEGDRDVKLNCCVAKKRPFGSGWAWTHAKGCPVDPNQKVRGAELAELHARLAHPAGKGAGYVPGGTPAPETAGRT
jgi:hypothetical protein